MSTQTAARTAVVTGAAQGIGQALAVRLARDGLRVVILDVQDATETVEMIRADGGDAHSIVGSVADEDEVGRMRDEAIGRYGRVDVLVNNAMSYAVGPVEDMPFADWRRVLAIGLDALFLTSRAFIPSMKENGWGRIVNISSNTLGLSTVASMSAYIAAKGGAVGFTRALATDLGPFGITVNCIAPGMTKTPVVAKMAPPEVFDQMIGLQAVKRASEPRDLAGALSFLVSDDASFVTAQDLVVDGGIVR